MNEEPENLLILPPLDESLADKIDLLKAHCRPMPMPTHTDAERKAFWSALLAELPAYLWYLEHWEIPPELKCERFGIVHYHHPELLAAIDDLAPEMRLLALIDVEVLPGRANHTWENTAEELAGRLFSGHFACEARRILNFPNAIGTYLGRLAKKRPDRVESVRTAQERLWKIKPKQ